MKFDLAVSRKFGRICSAKGRTCPIILGQNWLRNLKKVQLSTYFAYRPIIVHIVVIDGQVLKNKTYIWLESNKIIKHA
jgi:hypothetical protein